MSQRETLAVEIPPELKRLIDADERFNYEVVEAALWQEFGGTRDPVIDRKIEHKEQQLSMIDRTMRDLEGDRENLENDLGSLYEARERRESHIEVIVDDAADTLRLEQLDPENDAVQNFVENEPISPEQLIKRVRERLEGGDEHAET